MTGHDAHSDADLVTRRVLWSLTSGLYLLGTTGDLANGPWNLMTINQVVQVSTTPRIVVLGVEQGSRTDALLRTTGIAALSLLGRDQRAVVRSFVKPVAEQSLDEGGAPIRLAGHGVHLAPNGAPVLGAAPGWLELRVTQIDPLGSHSAYFAEVTGAWADGAILSARPSEKSVELLRMEDTRMNYGG